MCAPLIPGFSSGIELQLVTAGAVSILWLTRYPGAEYELRLILFCGQLEFRRLNTICGCLKSRRLDSSYDWVELRLLDTSYSWLHPMAESYGWLEFQRLDTSYSWFHPKADSSSGGSAWLTADSSCGWLRVVADSILQLTRVPPAGLKVWLAYTLIYQVNLRTYSAKYIFFWFSTTWSQLPLIQALAAALRTLK